MRTTLTIVTAVSAICAFIAATVNDLPFNPRPWTPAFLFIAICALVGVTFTKNRHRAKPQTLPDLSTIGTVPGHHEITAALARLNAVMAGERCQKPEPPDGAIVECEECHVREHYILGNNAAYSTHLLTHPERCHVRT